MCVCGLFYSVFVLLIIACGAKLDSMPGLKQNAVKVECVKMHAYSPKKNAHVVCCCFHVQKYIRVFQKTQHVIHNLKLWCELTKCWECCVEYTVSH